MPSFTTAQLAEQLGAELVGDGSIQITGFAPADQAQPGHLTFAETDDYFAKAEQGGAAAILVGANANSTKKTLLRVKNPRVAFAGTAVSSAGRIGSRCEPRCERHATKNASSEHRSKRSQSE